MPELGPGPEESRLADRLFNTPHRRLLALDIVRGDGPATREDICREINSALDQRAAGTAVVSQNFGDIARTPIDVRNWLASRGL